MKLKTTLMLPALLGIAGLLAACSGMSSSENNTARKTRSALKQGFTTAALAAPANESLLGSQTPDGTFNDGVNYELGLRFKASVDGKVTTLKFYKSARETGAHVGRLYSSAGKKIAEVTFANESASGWQSAKLATPVSISAGQEYVAAVTTGRKYYVASDDGLPAGTSKGNLQAVAGVFGPVGSMPTMKYRSSNYFRDVVFVAGVVAPPPPPPPPVTPPTPEPPTVPPSGITHGSQLTLAMVGPAAIGFTQLKPASGSSIYSGESYPFAKRVSATAVYDGITVEGPHMLIQGYDIKGTLDIYADETIVIRGNRIHGAGYWNIFGRGSGQHTIYVLYNDLGGDLQTKEAVGLSVYTIGPRMYVYRNVMTNMGDGVDLRVGNVSIIENYMHDFADDGSHNDGVMNYGGEQHVRILRNKILNQIGETSALNITSDIGSMNDWTVDGNYLAGGGYVCYCGGGNAKYSSTNVAFTNNIFGLDFFPKSGLYGPLLGVMSTAPGTGNVFSGNKYSNGQPVNP